jgi:hypothetical protein
MTFLVDGSADVTDGVLSLAIAPEHSTEIPEAGTDAGADVTPPFAIDFDKPTDAGFTPEVSGNSDQGSGGSSSSTPPPPTTTDTSGGGTTTTTTPASGPTGSVNLPAATTPDVGGGAPPVVAGQQPTGTTQGGGAAPAAAVAPAKADNSRHDLLLVLLVLILFGILYTQNAAMRAPRAVAGAPRPAGGDAAALPVPYPLGLATPRGLGRFNKQRTGAARPLI